MEENDDHLQKLNSKDQSVRVVQPTRRIMEINLFTLIVEGREREDQSQRGSTKGWLLVELNGDRNGTSQSTDEWCQKCGVELANSARRTLQAS